MPSQRPRQPYRGTSVNYNVSLSHINKLLTKYGIETVNHTTGWSEEHNQYCIMVHFTHYLLTGDVNQPIPIAILIGLDSTPKDKHGYAMDLNQVYRAMFYYLKSKFEAIAFGFDILHEFLPHIQVRGPNGQIQGVAEVLLPRLRRMAALGTQTNLLQLEDHNESS